MAERSYQDVRDGLFGKLHSTSGKKISYHHKVATHIGKGQTVLAAYIAEINEVEQFKADGLTLVPGDVLLVHNVEDLLAAVLDDYKSRGWRIYYV